MTNNTPVNASAVKREEPYFINGGQLTSAGIIAVVKAIDEIISGIDEGHQNWCEFVNSNGNSKCNCKSSAVEELREKFYKAFPIPQNNGTHYSDVKGKEDCKCFSCYATNENVFTWFLTHAASLSDNSSMVKEFNDFIRKWCGENSAHLLDSDDNDGQKFRDRLSTSDSTLREVLGEVGEDEMITDTKKVQTDVNLYLDLKATIINTERQRIREFITKRLEK